jgi:DNA modification methylase
MIHRQNPPLLAADRATVHHGDCLDVMARMPEASVDSVVTDPPYGLEFMGKEWDHGVPGAPFWRAALRVAKPGATLLAFGGTRTSHRLACAVEDAGWELRRRRGRRGKYLKRIKVRLISARKVTVRWAMLLERIILK